MPVPFSLVGTNANTLCRKQVKVKLVPYLYECRVLELLLVFGRQSVLGSDQSYRPRAKL